MAFRSGYLSTTTIKRLTSTEPPLRILVWSYIMMSLMAAAPAAYTWRTPTLEELAYIAAMGVFSAWGQSCMVNSLRVGEATMTGIDLHGAPLHPFRRVLPHIADLCRQGGADKTARTPGKGKLGVISRARSR